MQADDLIRAIGRHISAGDSLEASIERVEGIVQRSIQLHPELKQDAYVYRIVTAMKASVKNPYEIRKCMQVVCADWRECQLELNLKLPD